MEASAEFPTCSESVWTSCKDESVLQAPVQDGSSPTGAGSTEREASERSVSRPTTTHCSSKDVCFLEGFDRDLLASKTWSFIGTTTTGSNLVHCKLYWEPACAALRLGSDARLN